MKYLLSKTDKWHSYASRQPFCICDDSQDEILKACIKQALSEGHTLSDDDIANLQSHGMQTQGYAGEGEFYIESIDELEDPVKIPEDKYHKAVKAWLDEKEFDCRLEEVDTSKLEDQDKEIWEFYMEIWENVIE